MNTSNLKLPSAVAMALGLSIIPTSNALATMYAPSSPFVFASEIDIPTGSTKSFGVGLSATGDDKITIDISPLAGRTVNDVSPLEIRLTLTGGATFSSTAPISLDSVVCAYTGAVNSPVNILNGLDGNTTITFKMKNGDIAASSPKCVVGGGAGNKIIIKLNSGQKDYGMTVSAQIAGPDPLSFSTAGNIVTFTQAAGLSVAQNAVTIDVANPSLSQKFKGPTNNAKLGVLQYKMVSDTKTAMNVDASITPAKLVGILATDILQSPTKLTITGSPLMAGGTAYLIAGTIASHGDCSQASLTPLVNGTETFKKTASVSGLVSFNAILPSQLAAGVTVCYIVDGSTRVEKGNITFAIENVAGSGLKPNLTTTDQILTKFYKNGTSVKVLNIPSPTNTQDQPYIRVYNMGGTQTKVYGSMYEQSGATGGTLLGKGIELATIDAGAVKVLAAADLAKAFSVADWKGRAWLQLEGDSQQIRVQALIRSGGPGGVLVNASDRILGDGDAVFRSDSTWTKK